METKSLIELNDQELIQKKKRIKTNAFLLATFFGLFLGVAIYAAANKGGFITLIPLIAGFIVLGKLKINSKVNKEIKEVLDSRNFR